MSYISNTHKTTKFRLLISGFSNTGKTTSLPTFVYGPYDYHNDDQRSDAIEYAAQRSMVILVCPGETGIRSLPINTDHITSYYHQSVEGEDITSAEWSRDALSDYNKLYKEVEKNKPDILIHDGIHWLSFHLMNDITDGQFLRGDDLDINPDSGKMVQYRAARYYHRLWGTFGQYLAVYYGSSIHTVAATVWEKWEEGSTDNKRTDVQSTRYLWPQIPGAMAKDIVGRFDARVSARVERHCFHAQCEDSRFNRDHYVWQFLPRGDVVAVGIKGLRVTEKMKQQPFIHQDYSVLQGLMDHYS